MTRLKKLLAIVLAMVLMLSMSVSALAQNRVETLCECEIVEYVQGDARVISLPNICHLVASDSGGGNVRVTVSQKGIENVDNVTTWVVYRVLGEGGAPIQTKKRNMGRLAPFIALHEDFYIGEYTSGYGCAKFTDGSESVTLQDAL